MTSTFGAGKAPKATKWYRSAATGRYVSHGEKVAAARARVAADKKRNVTTAPWIIALAADKKR